MAVIVIGLHMCINLYDFDCHAVVLFGKDNLYIARQSDLTFCNLSLCNLLKVYSTVWCVSISSKETRVNAITYGMGLMWLRGQPTTEPCEYMWHWSVSRAKKISLETEERSSLSIISTKWVSSRYFSFLFFSFKFSSSLLWHWKFLTCFSSV